MTGASTAGQKTVIGADVGKSVVTCFGKPTGTIDGVSEDGAIALASLPEGRAYLRSVGRPCPADSPVRLRPEDAAMVTPETVWLRL